MYWQLTMIMNGIICMIIDVDNLSKFVLDALNKAAYLDDSQVVALKAVKLYADDGPSRIVVMLKSLRNADLADQLLR